MNSFEDKKSVIIAINGIVMISGARENRTPNLLIANQPLCQLSYSPESINYFSNPSYISSINGPYLSSTNFRLILKLGVISPDSIEKVWSSNVNFLTLS